MRGLNLSRLAKASEGRHFAEEGARQVAKLRRRLTPEQIAEAQAGNSKATDGAERTVDTVAAIAAQAAYRRIAIAEAEPVSGAPAARPVSALMQRLNNPKESRLTASKLQVSQDGGFSPDPGVMRALGQGRMAVYHRLKQESAQSRPLPGSEIRAEAAIVGMSAFVVATAIVGSIGVAGATYLYLRPSTVDGFRKSSVRLRERLEAGALGRRLKRTAEGLRQEGPAISPETAEKARDLAHKAVGVGSSKKSEHLHPGDASR